MTYIFLYILLVCLFVCLCPINVKKAESIGPKFCVGHHMTRGKVYGLSKFQQKKYKICKLFVCFCFTIFTKKNVHNQNRKWAQNSLKV